MVAVALAARRFAQHHLDDCAMQRVLGLGQRELALAYAVELVGAGLLACAAGLALGIALHGLLVQWLHQLLQIDLPATSPWSALLGLVLGMVLLLGFGLSPILQLAQVPPLRVLRRDAAAPRGSAVLATGVTACRFAVDGTLVAARDARGARSDG